MFVCYHYSLLDDHTLTTSTLFLFYGTHCESQSGKITSIRCLETNKEELYIFSSDTLNMTNQTKLFFLSPLFFFGDGGRGVCRHDKLDMFDKARILLTVHQIVHHCTVCIRPPIPRTTEHFHIICVSSLSFSHMHLPMHTFMHIYAHKHSCTCMNPTFLKLTQT